MSRTTTRQRSKGAGAQAAPTARPLDGAALIEALPIGIAIYDADQRVVSMNAAYCACLDLPPGAVAPGTDRATVLRQAAIRGVFGPGDPDAQVAELLAADLSRPGRLFRHHLGGRTFDLVAAPLPGGGHVMCATDTTALASARAEAEASAARLAGAFASLRIGIGAFDESGALTLFNARFAELLGAPADRLRQGMAFADLLRMLRGLDEYAGLDGEAFLTAQAGLHRGRPTATRRVRSDGKVIDIVSDPLADGGWTMTVTDISALATAEDEARRRARMLDGLLDAIPHGICVYGPDRRVSMFNRAYADLMRDAPVAVGERMDEVIRRRALAGEFGPGDCESIVAREMAHDISRPQMRRRRRPNGVAIDVRTAPMPDGGHVSVVTDVTSLVGAEDALAERVARMDTMLAHTRHGISLWSADRCLVVANAMSRELFDLPDGLLRPGLSYDSLLDYLRMRGDFGPEPRAGEVLAVLRAHDHRQPLTMQRETVSGRLLEIRCDPTPDGGFVATAIDISDVRRTEMELRRAKEGAEAANTTKARFLATMGHELRTPLNAVIGFSDALMRDRGGTDPVVVSEYAQEINQAGKRLLLLINTILDVARIEAGRYDLGSDRIDVARVVRASLRQARNAALAAEIDLVEDLPEMTPFVRGDERRMQQVLSNLISNAVKFNRPGGRAEVSVRLDANGDLLIRISDTGIGIAEKDLDRVFEPFTQLDSSLARQFEGTGLGLYVSRALVEAHGGQIALHSRLDEGTVAEIRLPAARVILPEPARLAGN